MKLGYTHWRKNHPQYPQPLRARAVEASCSWVKTFFGDQLRNYEKIYDCGVLTGKRRGLSSYATGYIIHSFEFVPVYAEKITSSLIITVTLRKKQCLDPKKQLNHLNEEKKDHWFHGRARCIKEKKAIDPSDQLDLKKSPGCWLCALT